MTIEIEICTKYDPRCIECDENVCFECADSILWSIRRSGARNTDPQLPPDELEREFAFQFEFGSQDPRVFDQVEPFFLIPSDAAPLLDSSQKCEQGLTTDDSWTCTRSPISHKVCGHWGSFYFDSPTYAINEDGSTIRLSVKRTGGGFGETSIQYDILHLETNASDVHPTAQYTSSQELVFEQGVIEKTFLITIHDDRQVEGDERFQVILHDPRGGASLGHQKSTIVTIIDDDGRQTDTRNTGIATSTGRRLSSGSSLGDLFSVIAGEVNTYMIQATRGDGTAQTTGGDVYNMEIRHTDDYFESQDSNPAVLSYGGVTRGSVSDNNDGSYSLTWVQRRAGRVSVSVYQSVQGGLRGDYFNNAWFQGEPETSRIDETIDFHWGNGYVVSTFNDFVTVRWTGDLLAPDTDIYHFDVNADNHIRLWIDGELLIDQWDRIVNNVRASKRLQLGTFYPIEIEYQETTGNAMVQLLWQRAKFGGPSVVVPKDVLYWRNHVSDSPYHNVIVSPSRADASATVVVGSATVYAVAGKQSTFRIKARDSFDNQIQSPDLEDITARLVLSSGSGGGNGPTDIHADVTWDTKSYSFIATYTCFISGIYQLHVQNAGTHVYGSPFSVVIEPGDCHGTYSVVSGPGADAMVVHAAGTETTVTIEARDTHGNRRTSTGDRFDVRAYHQTLDAVDIATVLDDGNGIYTARFTPRFKGIYHVAISLNDNVPVAASPYTITVQSGAASSRTLVSGNAIATAYTGVVNSFDISAYDENGNSLETGGMARALWLEPPSGGANIIGTCVDLLNGRYQGQYVPMELGTHQLHITVNGFPVYGTPFPVNVLPGPTSGARCAVTGEGIVAAVAGIRAEFILQVKDIYGNDKVYGSGSETLSVVLTGISAFPADVKYIGYGKYLISYTAEAAGTYNVRVIVDGEEPASGPFTVVVAPGPICAKCSLVSCESGSDCALTVGDSRDYEGFIAGDSMPILITAKDKYYNERKSGGDRFIVTYEGPWPSKDTGYLPYVDQNDGTYKVLWSPEASGRYKVKVIGLESGGLDTTYYGSPQLLDPVLLNRVENGPLVRDYHYTAPVGMNRADGFSVKWEGYLIPEYTEKYTFRLSAGGYSPLEIDGGARLYINDKLVVDTSPSAWYSTSKSTISHPWTMLSGTVALTANALVSIRVELTEGTDQTTIALWWKSMSRIEAIVPSERLHSSSPLLNDLNYMTIRPAIPHPPSFTVRGSTHIYSETGEISQFVIVSRDRFGNALWNGGQNIHTLLYDHDSFASSSPFDVETQDKGDGEYLASYTATTTGRFGFIIASTDSPVLRIGLDEYRMQLVPFNIRGSPFILNIEAVTPSGAQSTAIGDGSVSTTAGVLTNFILQLRDQWKNAVIASVDGVQLRLVLLDGETTVAGTLQDRSDGTFVAEYLPTISGRYAIEVLAPPESEYDRTEIILVVHPTVPAADTSKIVSNSLTSSIAIDTRYTFEVELRDRFNNVIDYAGNVVAAVVTGPVTVHASLLDAGGGKTYMHYQVPVGGTYSIILILLTAKSPYVGGGLIGKYYHTSTTPLTEPSLSHLDSTIAFDWRSIQSTDTHLQSTREYGRIRWTGYILPKYSEEYTFLAQVDAGISLQVDGRIVIDQLFSSGGTYQGSIELKEHVAYEIVVEYWRGTAPPSSEGFITLEWASVRTPIQVLPSEALYPQAEEIYPQLKVTAS